MTRLPRRPVQCLTTMCKPKRLCLVALALRAAFGWLSSAALRFIHDPEPDGSPGREGKGSQPLLPVLHFKIKDGSGSLTMMAGTGSLEDAPGTFPASNNIL